MTLAGSFNRKPCRRQPDAFPWLRRTAGQHFALVCLGILVGLCLNPGRCHSQDSLPAGRNRLSPSDPGASPADATSEDTSPADAAPADAAPADAASTDAASTDASDVFAASPLTSVTIRSDLGEQQLVGRVLVQAADGGLLLEEPGGRIRQFAPAALIGQQLTSQPFVPHAAAALSAELKQQAGAEFQCISTDHYVICSDGNPIFAEMCGRLLETVHDRFFEFFRGSHSITLRPLQGHLPVMVFSSVEDYRRFAADQHPDVDFADTPGYYSVRDNQILLTEMVSAAAELRSESAIRRKLSQSPRQIATIVHEAVHQLAFNTGLHVRLADNPLWLTEGLAVWFEPASPRAKLLWSRPGQVNPVHHPAFQHFSRGGRLHVPLEGLLSANESFAGEKTVAAAYAESWALTAYLIRHHRRGYDRLLARVAARKPLIVVSAEERLTEFQDSVGRSLHEIDDALIPFVARLRAER